MNADPQLDLALRSWLQRELAHPANRDRVIGHVLNRVATTSQVRRSWGQLRLLQRARPPLDGPRSDMVVPVVPVQPLPGRPAVRGLAIARNAVLVAAAVVVLVGGVLLAARTTERGLDSAAPATTSALLAGMTVEELQPGVLRVLGDGFRNLAAGPWSSREIPLGVATGPDASVWIHGRTGTFRLGVAGMSADGVDSASGFDFYDEVQVAPDGSLWAAGVGTAYSVRTFHAGSWTQPLTRVDGKVHYTGLAVGPDGTVWSLRSVVDIPASEYQDCLSWTDCGWARYGYEVIEPDGTVDALVRLSPDGSAATMPSWLDVHAGPVAQGISVGPDGSVWLMGIDTGPEAQMLGGDVQALLRFDGSAWEAFPVPSGLRSWSGWRNEGRSFDVGSDGTLWAGVFIDPGDRTRNGDGLARLDPSGWTVFRAADGIQPWGIKGGWGNNVDLLAAAPDGSVWVNAVGSGGGDGVARFDGNTWSRYLRGLTVHDLAIAADGSAWVSADTAVGGLSPYTKTRADGLYVILPSAAGE